MAEKPVESARQDEPGDAHSHGQVLRDVIAFQFKLLLDGLRDVILSPVSILAALLGLVTDSQRPGKYFYRLLRLGHQSDRWINLFNSHGSEDPDEITADTFVRHAESIVLNEYKKKGEKKQNPP